MNRLRALIAVTGALVFATAGQSVTRAASPVLPPIKHVFVIVLENEGYAATFVHPVANSYLGRALPARGALLTQYYGIGHLSNDNYIAMVSGQAPNPQTQDDCMIYSDFISPGLTLAPGQAVGTGCVFPSKVHTIADQLDKKGLSWKGYMEDMGGVPSRESATCGHPALNTQDKTQSAVKGDGYAARHNPFVYFHSIIDNQKYCNAHVVGLAPLATDLQSKDTTPNFSFIVPDLCDDGHDFPCKNETMGASAFNNIDTFLRMWVPKIEQSAAFKNDGLLAIMFDESSGATSDAGSCCGESPGPNSPLPGILGLGGGRTGAVLLSPYIKPGTVNATPYNHYGLLASFENLFGLKRLGMAQTVPGIFGADVFTAKP
jgi:hypothetical protein